MLVQQRVRLFVITLSNPLPDGSFILKVKKLYQVEISFHFLIILQMWIRRKHETLSPWEDHQCRVNLWNLGLWRHAPYISEQALIRFLYLRRERLTISNLSFMHKVHDGLPQVFIDPIGFTLAKTSNFIVSRHCCGVGFWSKCVTKWAAKVSEFLSCYTFCAIAWKYCSILF